MPSLFFLRVLIWLQLLLQLTKQNLLNFLATKPCIPFTLPLGIFLKPLDENLQKTHASSLVFGSPVLGPEKDRNRTGPRPQKDRTCGPVFSFLRCKDRKKTGLSEPVLTG